MVLNTMCRMYVILFYENMEHQPPSNAAFYHTHEMYYVMVQVRVWTSLCTPCGPSGRRSSTAGSPPSSHSSSSASHSRKSSSHSSRSEINKCSDRSMEVCVTSKPHDRQTNQPTNKRTDGGVIGKLHFQK